MFFRWLWLYLWEWSGVCPVLVLLGPRDHGSLRQLHPDVRSCPRNLCVAVFTAPVSSPGFGEYKLPTLPGVQYLLLYNKMLVSNFFLPQSHQIKSLRSTCSFSIFSILPVIHDFPWKELMWWRISTFITTSTVMWISLLTIQISASHLQLFPVHFLLLVTAKHSHKIFKLYVHNNEILIELVL